MLLHNRQSVSHLFLNVIIQIFFGTLLELVHCWWRIATIYLSGVITGAILHAWLSPETNVIGASAGVYALITAHIAVIVLNWNEMKSGFYQLLFFSIYILVDVISTLYEPQENVSHSAHLGGGIGGLFIGIGVLRNLKVEKHEKYIWWTSVTVFTISMFCAIVHIFMRS